VQDSKLHSLEFAYLSSLEIPAPLSAGISSLNLLRRQSNPLFEGGKQYRPLLPTGSSLPHHNTKHTSEPALKGYCEALTFIHQSRPPLNIDTLLALHQKIFQYLDGSGGKFKTGENALVSTDADGKKAHIHTPYSARDIPQAMETFISRYDQAIKSYDPLIVIPLALMDFIFIHPFMDGNGRSFRLLSVLMLYHAGFECASSLNLDAILKNSHSTGQKALAAGVQGWRESKHNVLPWVNYFVGAFSYAYSQPR